MLGIPFNWKLFKGLVLPDWEQSWLKVFKVQLSEMGFPEDSPKILCSFSDSSEVGDSNTVISKIYNYDSLHQNIKIELPAFNLATVLIK